MTRDLIDSAADALTSRTSRRGFIARVTVAGAAIAGGPIRWLLYPQRAWAESGTCSGSFTCGSGCANGHCDSDGFTTFCCTINSGVNRCPSNTFPGGWWRCDSYTGSHLCSTVGKRWYVDCNLNYWDGSTCTPRCASGDCANRQTCCVCFRYGNCNANTHPSTSVVVCRVVLCGNPGSAGPYASECSTVGGSDNSTCSNDASCL